ncbi:hypothetical protein [Pedobacter panaciterrae]
MLLKGAIIIRKKFSKMANNNLVTDKIYFFMKCSFLLIAVNLTFIGVLFASSVRSQNLNQKIKLKLENASVENCLSTIEKQSNIQINAQVSLLNKITKK